MKELERNRGGLPAGEARNEVKGIVSTCASVVRAERELTQELERLEKLKGKGISLDERGLPYALETENIVDVAEMVLRTALLRRESRGPHLFFGHFEDLQPVETKDPEWRKYVVINKGGEQIKLEPRKPVEMGV